MEGEAPMPLNLTPNVVCDHCRKAFRVRPSIARKTRFCSRQCYTAYTRRTPFLNEDGSWSIPLRSGHVAIVDADDIDLVGKYTWWSDPNPTTTYARAQVANDKGRRVFVSMHRLVLGLDPDERTVDHIDGNGLNNRRSNLRLCSSAENSANRHSHSGATSRYKGVSWYRRDEKWRSYIWINGKQKHLGFFDGEEDAARAHDHAARESFGVFARVNFPTDDEQGAVR